MVEEIKNPSQYGLRLAHAMGLPGNGMTAPKLASDLGLTRQAIDKLLKGGSSEMGANNNARVARHLGVDPTWLATGEGVPRPSDFQVRWHERALIEQFRELPPEDQEDVAEMLRSKLELVRQHAGKRTANPFEGVSRSLPAPITDTGAPALRPRSKKSTK
jgi:transcriptional regulator with XRE-family HTH domain